MTDLLPIGQRLTRVFPVSDQSCLMCDHATESMDHLFLRCPFLLALWSQSPWQLRLDQINPPSISAWVTDLYFINPLFVIPLEVRQEILNYVAVGMEMTWWLRNKIRVGEPVSSWSHLFTKIHRSAVRYWRATLSRRLKRAQITRPCRWAPPPLGWIKINFDAAYRDGVAHPAVIVRDSHGVPVTAWTSELLVDGPFSAEASAAVMALKLGELQHTDCIVIEGDALTVIQNIEQHTPILDWRGEALIQESRTIYSRNVQWKLQFTPRSGNRAAHNLAALASRASVCGFLTPSSLPPEILSCDLVRSDSPDTVTVLDDDDFND